MKRLAVLVALLLMSQFLGVYYPAAETESSTSTPIKHVVMIMMENHSFDNIFGLYPTMNKTNPGPILSSLQAPADVLNVSSNVILSQLPNGTYSTADPNEESYISDWDNGKMDGFLYNSGAQAMTYFGPSQMGIEWDWAEDYAIGDNYFSSCLCETDPNRLYSLAGFDGGLTGDYGPPPYIPVNQTIFGELSQHGVSWAYYIQNPQVNDFPLNYFTGISTYSSQIQGFADFKTALQQGTLPSVSWVQPVGGGADDIDEHPPANVTIGEDWLLGIVDSIMSSSYWNSTAIFITYDEGGGYYDQVPPPTLDGVLLGFRVPFFVISPYAKENYVSNTVMNHASQLAFIDYNWKLPALNQFVADSDLPLDMFNFQNYPTGSATRPPVLLSNESTFPVNPQLPLNQLPYSRLGSSAETLANITTSVAVQNNTSITPFYETLPFIVIAVGVVAVVAVVLNARLRSRRSS